MNDLVLQLSHELVEAIATRAAEIVLTRTPAPAVASPYMTVPEAAEYMRCGEQRIRNLRSARRLSSLNEGGRAICLKAELDALLVADGVALPLPTQPRRRSGARLAR